MPLEITGLCYKFPWKYFHKGKSFFVEIGSGHGELAQYLSSDINNTVVTFEISKLFAKRTAKMTAKNENVFVIHGNAYSNLKILFKRESIDKLYILFPDPWHKKKHHKRRPINKNFFMQIYSLLKKNGSLVFISDYAEYFDYVFKEFYFSKQKFQYEVRLYSPKSAGLVETHYYKKWRKLGKKYFYSLTLTK